MKLNRRWKKLGIGAVAGVGFGIVAIWGIGGVLVAPANHPVGAPPPGLAAENVTFPSASGSTIHGWFAAGQRGRGAVLLMHGIHSDRRSQAARAEWLARAGYSVLLFDFQAHGESSGQQITFGHLESRDATAAVHFLQAKLPGEKIGVIGVSLGAASALLADPPLPVNALVLESSYPTLYQATADRLAVRFGRLGRLATPLLTCQLKPRLGVSLDDLRPIERVRTLTTPKLFISGTTDLNTPFGEAQSLFAAAAEPKESWWVAGAAHVDLHDFAGAEYERRVLAFLAANLGRNDSVQTLE